MLHEVHTPMKVFLDRDILSNYQRLRKGEVFLIVEHGNKHVAWWRILASCGVRYVWFPEWEKSRAVE